MNPPSLTTWSAGLLAALLLAGSGAAAARTSVGIHLQLGLPGAVVHGWSGASVGLHHGALPYSHYRHHRGWRHGWAPGALLVVPPLVYGAHHGAPLYAEPAAVEPPVVSVGPTRPEPVITPRNGQDSQQTEYDRQQCNRWVVTQAAAMADAAVFHRTVQACMDERGYTLR